MRRPVLSPLLTALLAACSGNRPVTEAPRPGAAAGARLEGPTRVVPALEPTRLLDEEPGVARYLAVGGVRVRVREGRAEAATQGFGSPLVGGRRDADGSWLFVLANGTLARAREFLGTATRAGRTRGPVARAYGAAQGLVLVDPEGVRRWLEGADAGPPPASPAVPAVPDAERALARRATLEAHSWATLVAPGSALLATGLLAARSGNEVTLSRMEQDGRFVVLGRMPLGDAAPAECSLNAWGSRVLWQCPLGSEGAAYRLSLLGVRAPTSLAERLDGRLLPGRDGRTLTLPGACPGSASGAELATRAEATESTLACTWSEERGWHEWQYRGRGALLDVYDDVALVLDTTSRATSLTLYHIDAADRLAAPLSDPTVEVMRAGFLPDGRVAVLGRAGSAARPISLFAAGAPGAMLVWHSLSDTLEDLAFGDAEHGVAVGPTAGSVLHTEDGGITWTHLEVAVSAPAEQVELLPTRAGEVARLGERVECAPTFCRAGGRLVHRWERTNPAGMAVLE